MYKLFRFCKYALSTSNILSCIYMLYTVLANSVNGCIVQRTWTSLPYFTSSAPLIKMVSFTSVHQLSKPLSAVLPDVRRKLLTCDLWLALCLVTCHQGIYYSLARHRQLLTQHWANMSCSLYLFPSSLEWLRCCHIWQIIITSVKCFWIHGGVPWMTPRQASGSGSRVITCQSNTGDR